MATTVLVFQFTFSGTTYTVAMASGVNGWTLIAQSAAGADEVVINAAIVHVGSIGGGVVHLKALPAGITYDLTAPIVDGGYNNIILEGEGWSSVLRVHDNTTMNAIEPSNISGWFIRDLKIDCNKANNPEDPGAGNQQCGIFALVISDSIFENLYIHDAPHQAIRMDTDTYNSIINCWGVDNNRRHIELHESTQDLILSCHSTGNGITGYHCESNSSYNTYYGCESHGDWNGLNIVGDSTGNLFVHCTIIDATNSGISHTAGTNNIIHGCNITGAGAHGIYLNNGDYNFLSDNVITNPTLNGVSLEGNASYNIVINNQFTGGARGVRVFAATCVGNVVHPNRYIGPFGTALITDGGTGTILATHPIQLIQGTTFISAAGSAWGWEINANTEFALGIGWLPLEIQQVVRIRVIGVALAAPGAGDYMRIQITGEGATFAEDFATEPIDVVDHNNEEVNVQVDEVVNWIFTATDDADIGHLLGGDRLQIKVLHEGAGNGDAATNAIVDTVQIEYV